MCYRLLHDAQTVPAREARFRFGFLLGGLLLLLSTEGRSEEFRRLDQEQTPPEFATREEWMARAHDLRTRIMVSAGLEPLPAPDSPGSQAFTASEAERLYGPKRQPGNPPRVLSHRESLPSPGDRSALPGRSLSSRPLEERTARER